MAAGSGSASDGRGTVLVVEDDLPLLEVLGMLLEFEHFRCLPAADGLRALELLEEQRPALVILDWLLPKMSGPQVLAAIRERYGSKVPVLVLSAIADAEQARQAGADDYLRKPYAIEELVAAIQRLIQPR
jgi:DNA-binding response OmpR family regulator